MFHNFIMRFYILIRLFVWFIVYTPFVRDWCQLGLLFLCIASDVRGCTKLLCIQLRIPSLSCPILRPYSQVSPACFTVADIRKVQRRKNSTCVHFHIPFSYSPPFYLSSKDLCVVVIGIFLLFCRDDFRYPIWTSFCSYFTSIYGCTLTLIIYVNYIILQIDLNSSYLKIYMWYIWSCTNLCKGLFSSQLFLDFVSAKITN